MEVMATRRAITAPTPPPMATPPAISASVIPSSAPWAARVARAVATAMPIPIMPSWLPRRLVTGDDSPRSVRMNSTPETR